MVQLIKERLRHEQDEVLLDFQGSYSFPLLLKTRPTFLYIKKPIYKIQNISLLILNLVLRKLLHSKTLHERIYKSHIKKPHRPRIYKYALLLQKRALLLCLYCRNVMHKLSMWQHWTLNIEHWTLVKKSTNKIIKTRFGRMFSGSTKDQFLALLRIKPWKCMYDSIGVNEKYVLHSIAIFPWFSFT